MREDWHVAQDLLDMLMAHITESYYTCTDEILGSFADMELPVGDGNIIFPEGNALRNLCEYFTDEICENP